MKILNFGSCNLDFVYSLDHIVAAGETERTKKMEIFAGGKGLNQSIAMARAGAYVYHAGYIGTDGKMLRDILESDGVNTSFLKTADAKNGHAIIQVSSDGENSIFLYPGSNEMNTEGFIDGVLSNFSSGDIVVLQNEINLVDYIVDRAYEKGMAVVLNPSPFNENIRKIDFSKLSYILINEIEAKQISSCDDEKAALEQIICQYPHLKIVLTLGKNGCIYKDSENEAFHKAFSVTAVDSTGAGDTFAGYFVAMLMKNIDVLSALRLASAAAAISVTQMGAAPSIPRLEVVEDFLKHN